MMFCGETAARRAAISSGFAGGGGSSGNRRRTAAAPYVPGARHTGQAHGRRPWMSGAYSQPTRCGMRRTRRISPTPTARGRNTSNPRGSRCDRIRPRRLGRRRVNGRTAWLGIGDLRVDCEVAGVQPLGSNVAASLFFRLAGGGLGDLPIFASISGYERTTQGAIVAGGCNWACSFGPVLTAGLSGGQLDDPDVQLYETTIDGRRFRVVLSGLDRSLTSGDTNDGAALTQAARRELAGWPFLTPRVLEGSQLPLLTAEHTLVSVFVAAAPQQTTYEIKVNGSDWPPATVVGPPRQGASPGAVVLLRELAVVSALEPAPQLTAAPVQRTLNGLAMRALAHQVAGWPGWAAHDGQLGPALDETELREIERTTGPLPTDYRTFLRTVAGSGAAPGYGLLSPRRVDDVIPLAHAGCGVTWVLHLDGERAGTVWVDAGGSDGSVSQVAGSFSQWYMTWLDHAVRDYGPWLQWDHRYCATTSAVSQYLQANPPEPGTPPYPARRPQRGSRDHRAGRATTDLRPAGRPGLRPASRAVVRPHQHPGVSGRRTSRPPRAGSPTPPDRRRQPGATAAPRRPTNTPHLATRPPHTRPRPGR